MLMSTFVILGPVTKRTGFRINSLSRGRISTVIGRRTPIRGPDRSSFEMKLERAGQLRGEFCINGGPGKIEES